MKTVFSSLMNSRFLVLLIMLAIRLLGVPLFYALTLRDGHRFLGNITSVLVLLTLLAALFAVSRTRRSIILSAVLFAGSIAADIGYWLLGRVALFHASDFLELLFLSWCTVLIISHIFRAKDVRADTIAASLCAYLLMGLAWGALYGLIEQLQPGSFNFSAIDGSFDAVYLSFVTLSTLGLGDIIPQTANVRMLVSCEALTGQIYLAVLVARLVGLHIAARR